MNASVQELKSHPSKQLLSVDALPQGIQWSTESVLENSVKQAQACGLRVAPIDTLPTLQDIDVIEVGHLN